MSRRLPLAAILLVGTLATRAAAQTPAAPPAAAQDLARILLTQKSYDALMERYSGDIARQLAFATSHGGGQPAKDLPAKVRADLAKGLSYQQVTELQAAVLVKHYTPEELQQLVTFYRSPLGQKVLSGFPAVSDEVTRQIQERVGARASAIADQYLPKTAPNPKPAKKPAK